MVSVGKDGVEHRKVFICGPDVDSDQCEVFSVCSGYHAVRSCLVMCRAADVNKTN